MLSAELSKPYLGNIYNDKYKMNAFLSILSLINISIVEGQSLKGFFVDIEKLFENIINKNHWIILYCEWLFILLKHIGYEIDYKKNQENQFYNIYINKFENINENNNIIFPHNLFLDHKNINFIDIKAIFDIFESIFIKNHLENINYKMPENFKNFKNLILSRLK